MAGSIHGGSFWKAVGNDLDRLRDVIRADVLDAWFPPAPGVLAAFAEFSVDLCRTSPEVDARPLSKAISLARGIPEECILTAGGSSALIFLAFPVLAASARSAVVLDPMYGEYRHVVETLCCLPSHTLTLSPEDTFRLDPARLLTAPGDLVLLVNPNSPTGRHVPRAMLGPIVKELAKTRIVWIDETYIEYAGSQESLESLACDNPNVIVCKSMSKVYALSGLRCAYLVSHPSRVAELQRHRPPWAVSLPAQVCGAAALRDPAYYVGRYGETAGLRSGIRAAIEEAGFEVTEGCINALMVHLPPNGPSAEDVCSRSARQGVYLRDASSMGNSLGSHTLRVSVRSDQENARIVGTLADVGTPARL